MKPALLFRRFSFTTIIFTLLILLSPSIVAQVNIDETEFDSTSTYRVVLFDGSEFIGQYLTHTFELLSISTNSIPKIEIPVDRIKSINIVDQRNLKNGSYWFPNPNYSRYFFSPSAFNLKSGEGYYQNTYLLLNSVNFGVTDWFSIGGGFELVSTFNGSPFYYITPKVGFEIAENLTIGGGLLYASIESESFGIGYALSTYGNYENNVTFGLGYGFLEDEIAERPVLTLSGMTRVSRRMSLVTENWFIPESENNYYGIISYGVRFFGEKLSVDLGFLNNSDFAEAIAIGIPYVDFVVKFR